MALPNITIDGRLVADPELRFTGSGKAVAGLRVAASESKKDERGDWQTTEQIFVNVSLWEQDGEEAAEHLRKGDKVTVTGRIYDREYEKSDGTKGHSLEVKYPTVAKIVSGKRPQGGLGYQSAPSSPANDPWGPAPTSDAPPF